MKLAILSKHHIHTIIKPLIRNNNLSFYSYDSIDKIDFRLYSQYDYIIIVNCLVYIDSKELINFLSHHNPSYASLPTYWGMGSDSISIISNSVFTNFVYENKIKQLENTEYNTLCEIFCKIINKKKFSSLLQVKDIKGLLQKYRIVDISSIVYSNSIPNTKGCYHNSVFVHHTDDINYFRSWYHEHDSKIKIIGFRNKPYKAITGVNFFVINNKHISILNNDLYICWSTNKKEWLEIKSNIKKRKIQNYITKYAKTTSKVLNLTIV